MSSPIASALELLDVQGVNFPELFSIEGLAAVGVFAKPSGALARGEARRAARRQRRGGW